MGWGGGGGGVESGLGKKWVKWGVSEVASGWDGK